MQPVKILAIALIVFANHLCWRFVVSRFYEKFVHIRRLRKKGVSTKGIIIGHIEQLDLDQRTQYAPIVKFNTAAGVGVTIESDDFKFSKQTVGDRVDVSYYLDDPEGAIVNPIPQMVFNLFLVCFSMSILVGLSLVLIFLRVL